MPVELSFAERRVLGVLIEKGFTTPEQYPLSINSVVVGSNQKSCREPMSSLDEGKVLDSLESLRLKGFTTLVRMEGSRVDRWKHRFGETLALEAKQVAVLAELFLRGPQTAGEIGQRAARMRPIENVDEAEAILEGLLARPEPLVERLGPPGRRRGVKFAHAFYPASERPEAEAEGFGGAEPAPPTPPPSPSGFSQSSLVPRILAASSPSPPPRPTPAAPAVPAPAAAAVPSAALEELQRELQALKDRVAELEATFVRFLR